MKEGPFNSAWNSNSNNIRVSSKMQWLTTEKSINCLKTLKQLLCLNAHEQTLVVNEYITVWEQLSDFWTTHMIQSMMVPRVC